MANSQKSATDLVKDLTSAADKYFDLEEKRLKAQYNFLKAILEKRKGDKGLQDANAAGASTILTNSIEEYLGKPIG